MRPRTEARIRERGITLPALPAPAKTVGNLVFLAGVISTGACALTHLAILEGHLGSLEEIKGIVSVNGYVQAIPGFPDTPKVINGATDLFVEPLGESTRHVRAANGVSALPRNALVELQMTVEI